LFTSIDGLTHTFPIYIIVGNEDDETGLNDGLEISLAEKNPTFHGIPEYYKAPEFKVSSPADLAEVGWYFCQLAYAGGGSISDVDFLDIACNSIINSLGCTAPNGEAGNGQPVELEGELLEESLKILAGLLQTRKL
jgi:hypothetical protein